MIRPPIVTQLGLPRPEDPPVLLLVRHDLRREPLLVEVLVRVWRPVRGPLHVVGRAQAELAHDRRPVAAAVVVAGRADVVVLGDGHAAVPLEVPVVVVRGEPEVRERLVGVAGAPFGVHHLDVQLVPLADAEVLFHGADSLDSILEHVRAQPSGQRIIP